jgi:hypothetical protein
MKVLDGVGCVNELLTGIDVYSWACCLGVGVECVECGEESVEVLLNEWCV